ncbi:MAG: M23 family metallopeptidase [Patescibacteria group bacterium]
MSNTHSTKQKIYIIILRLSLHTLTARKLVVRWLSKAFSSLGRGPKLLGRWSWLVLVVKPYQLILSTRSARRQFCQTLLPQRLNQQQWLPMIIVLTVAVFVIVNNVSIRQVNAGDFGQNSLLNSLIEEDLEIIIEESVLPPLTNNEIASPILRSEGEILDLTNEDITATIDEGSTLIKPHLVTTERGIRQDPEQYIVKDGDTLSSIAAEFGVSLATLLWENRLSNYSVLRIGQKLTVLPTSGVSHRVAKGDTLSGIASRYGVEVDKISEFNNLADNKLTVGQIIVIPGGKPYVPPTPKTTSSSLLTSIAPNLSSNTKLLWPTVTRRISQYFSWRHGGVDLANAYGIPIYAAEDGVVQTSGWNRGGYGNYIIIDHGQGLKTLYGHNTKNLVSAGDRVARGQQIATMGSTGRSTGPHLHFEVYVNGQRVNPLNYIK